MMIGLNSTVPVQKFIDRDHYDLSQLYPGVTAAYKINGKLTSYRLTPLVRIYVLQPRACLKLWHFPICPCHRHIAT